LRDFFPARQDPVLPWAWAILHHVRVRAFRGTRYRLGLPARGQRTHTNACTTHRVRDAAARHIRAEFWVRRLWASVIRPVLPTYSRYRSLSKRALKAERHRRGVIRTQKKPSVWR
jgi:hypothetical protein